MGRLGEPREIGACAVWLASEKAGYVTGQTIHVNGSLALLWEQIPNPIQPRRMHEDPVVLFDIAR